MIDPATLDYTTDDYSILFEDRIVYPIILFAEVACENKHDRSVIHRVMQKFNGVLLP